MCDPVPQYLFYLDLDLEEGYIIKELLEDYLLTSSAIYYLRLL